MLATALVPEFTALRHCNICLVRLICNKLLQTFEQVKHNNLDTPLASRSLLQWRGHRHFHSVTCSCTHAAQVLALVLRMPLSVEALV